MPADFRRASRPRTIESLTVGTFFEQHGEQLRMRLIGEDCGFNRLIREPTINRPGLALAGFYTYFAVMRMQVIGKAERSYLKSLNAEERRRRFSDFCKRDIPCLVVSRGDTLPDDLLEIANGAGISVFRTTMVTMNFINAATIRLEWDFAPTQSVHGCMVDVMGIGVLICGASGTGKSECVLSLLRRGSSLVADDKVDFRNLENRELIGSAPELGRSLMEVRGIGIVDVAALFGIGSVRKEKRLDLMCTLRLEADMSQVDRHGLEQRYYNLLGLKIPEVEIPVAPGRDIAQLVEVAALDQKLRSAGYNAAEELNQRLLQKMKEARGK
ncbi:MAG: HPr(Ser) kinase/phosphatase [Verrucomicrobiota bacterium]